MTTETPNSADSLHRPRCGLAVDIGGTFTDIVLERGSRRWSHKTLTTHEAPEQGLLKGIAYVLADAGLQHADVDWFVHGTTLATNALLERRGARTALVTTEGYRDVLEIATEGRHNVTDLNLVKQRPLIERALRFTVRERMAADGTPLLALDKKALVDVAEAIKLAGVESVAVGFLHSYVNPAHEEEAGAILAEHLGDIPISLSSRICPEIREYDRFSTTAINAYVRVVMASYLDRLSIALTQAGMRCSIVIMASHGGVIPLQQAKETPVLLIESGPAGGAVLASSVARQLEASRVFSFDMGGTTAKICYIADYQPNVSRVFEADRTERFAPGSGLPVRIPAVELVEIGAGGGSIASRDRMQRLVIGPESAGSEPGPACYGNGGTLPTITDANLLLGRLSPGGFAGGKLRLRPEASVAAMGPLAQGSDEVGVAAGIVEIVDETMANAARAHAVELGLDLEAHDMVAFGGAAPLHAARVAEKLGIARVIIPASAGVGSAVGFLRAPVASDIVVARPMLAEQLDFAALTSLFARMNEQAMQTVGALGLSVDDVAFTRFADLRYQGQGSEIQVRFDGAADADDLARQLREGFATAYRRLFGRTLDRVPVEVVSWRLRMTSPPQMPDGGALARSAFTPETGERRIFDPASGRTITATIVDRQTLVTDVLHLGPALVVEEQTTTVVPESFTFCIDGNGHLILNRRKPSAVNAESVA